MQYTEHFADLGLQRKIFHKVFIRQNMWTSFPE